MVYNISVYKHCTVHHKQIMLLLEVIKDNNCKLHKLCWPMKNQCNINCNNFMTLNWEVFKVTVTVTSNHTIALVLVGFLVGSKKWWTITLRSRNNQGIGVSFTWSYKETMWLVILFLLVAVFVEISESLSMIYMTKLLKFNSYWPTAVQLFFVWKKRVNSVQFSHRILAFHWLFNSRVW